MAEIELEVIGNLGHDATDKNINGRDYLSFDVAPKGSGDGTMWVSCLYGNTRVKEWLTKGRQVLARGEYRDRLYTGRDGNVRIDRSVLVTRLVLLGGGDRAEENPFAGRPAPTTRPAPTNSPAQGQTRDAHAAPRPAPPADDDDDMPF